MWGFIAGFVLSTIGFSVFIYGKRQARAPQLVCGILMMACPLVVRGAWSVALSGIGLCVGLWLAIRWESRH